MSDLVSVRLRRLDGEIVLRVVALDPVGLDLLVDAEPKILLELILILLRAIEAQLRKVVVGEITEVLNVAEHYLRS